MAHQLGFREVSQFGTIAANLLGWGKSTVAEYTPQPPSKKQGGGWNDVTETIELMFYGSVMTEVQASINLIERWLTDGQRRSESGMGPKVYVYLWMEGDQMWRSEVVAGAISYPPRTLNTWGQAKIVARITFTRKPFWETNNELEVALSSYTQPAAAIGGRLIQNRKDSVGGNYVDIAPGAIKGVLPAPAKLILSNTTNATENHREIYIATTGLVRDPSHALVCLEAEDALFSTGTAGGAYASGGERLDLAFSGAQSTIRQWTIPQQLVALINGRTVRFIARVIFAVGGTMYMQASLKLADGIANVAQDGDEVRISTTNTAVEIFDLGGIRFPSIHEALSTAPLRLQVAFRSVASATLELDYIMLFIANTDDGLRQLYVQQGLEPSAHIVDDGPRGVTYKLTAPANLEDKGVIGYGPQVLLYPSENGWQRLYFLINQGFSAPVNKSLSVRVQYRPRRLTI